MPDHGRGNHQSEAGSIASRRSLALWIWSALFIADAILVTRRLSGEFAKPLPAALALLTTALVAMASLVAWQLFSHASAVEAESQWRRWQSRSLSMAATVLWAWAISAGATPQSAGLLFAVVALALWGVIAVDFGEVASASEPAVVAKPRGGRFADGSAEPEARTAQGTSATLLDQPNEVELVDPCDGIGEESTDDLDDSQTLWLARRQTDDGEQIEGWVRVRFAAGQRETTIHVAFCPPMSVCPEIETEELDGTRLEIRVAAVFPFGVRLSVRRSGTLDDRNSDRIGFIAQALPAQRAA